MDLLYSIPPLVASMIILAMVTAVSVGALVAVRRVYPHTRAEPNNEVAGFMFAVVGVIYAVILAFVFIAMWQQYSDSMTNIEHEASSLGAMFREARAIPDPHGSKVRQHIHAYTELVLNDEWPMMARREKSDKAFAEYQAIWSAVTAITPNTSAESNWHQALIARMNSISDCRRIRLSHAAYQAPAILWILLVVGAILTIAFSFLYGLKDTITHSIMSAALACMITLTIFAIYEFETPFRGCQQVVSDPYERELQIFALDSMSPGRK